MSTKKQNNCLVTFENDVEDVLCDLATETSVEFKPHTKAGKKFKKTMKKGFPLWFARNSRYIFVTLLVLLVSSYSFFKIQELSKQVTHLQDLQSQSKMTIADLTSFGNKKDLMIRQLRSKIVSNTFVTVNRETLMDDMATRFPSISDKIAQTIVDTVMEESQKYGMNPIILYSLGIVESSHRYWIEHAKITINVNQPDGSRKKITTRAVGWGGVVWEWHSKMLTEKGIASSRSDLFYPDVNIRATAAIYDMYFHMNLKDGVTNRDVSAQRRYFGGNYKSYSDKINAEVVKLVEKEIYRENIDG